MLKRIIASSLATVTVFALCACTAEKPPLDSQQDDTQPDTTAGFQYTPAEPFPYEEQMHPIWDGEIVYDEYVMFVGTDDKVPLLYTPTEIISVKSTDGTKIFEEGKDYILEDGKLVMPEGSTLTYIPYETYWSQGQYGVVTNNNGVDTPTYCGGLDSMAKYQLAITYKHKDTFPVDVPDCSANHEALIKKLEDGEDVTFIFAGDSITNGWDNSMRSGYAPHMPPWTALFTQYVAHTYGYTVKYIATGLKDVYVYPSETDVFGDRGTITYINNGVGGWTAEDGYKNLQSYVFDFIDTYGCDLFVVAYGANNWNGASDAMNSVKNIVEAVHEKAPQSELVAVSTMLPNNERTTGMGEIPQQENYLKENIRQLNESGIEASLAPMQSVHAHLCSVKRYRDHSGNNMNHPGDYTHRIYAQVLTQTVFGYK